MSTSRPSRWCEALEYTTAWLLACWFSVLWVSHSTRLLRSYLAASCWVVLCTFGAAYATLSWYANTLHTQAVFTNDVLLATLSGKVFPMSYLLRRAGGDLSVGLAFQGKTQLSRPALAVALETDPLSLDLLLNYAQVSFAEGDVASGMRALSRSFELDPQILLPAELRRDRKSLGIVRRAGDDQ